MDLRTRDRLTTAADVAPWLVAALAIAMALFPALRSAVRIETTRSSTEPAVVAGPPPSVADPYPPGQPLPPGFSTGDEKLVQIDQRAARARASRVAVVGDSLTVGATPGLRMLLADVNLRIDAKVGRSMPEGAKATELVKAATADLVVIALGSNDSCDPAECTRRVTAILDAVNPAAPVIWMMPATFRPNMGTVRTAIRQAVGARSHSVVLDWQPYQDAHPEIVQSDRIHLSPEGYRLRAEVTAAQVHSLLGG